MRFAAAPWVLVSASFAFSCTDSSTSPTPADPDGGGALLPDGGAIGVDAATLPPDDAAVTPDSAGGTCSIPGENYQLYGEQLFKVAADLTTSYFVAKVASDKNIAFSGSTTSFQVGTDLYVSDGSCPFCKISLPPQIVNGLVKAVPVLTGMTAVKYFFPSDPGTIGIWSGNGTSMSVYDIVDNKIIATAGLTVGGPGVTCTKLYAIKGSVSTTGYSVRFLAECGDGSGASAATIADVVGAKVGSNWTQSSYTPVASAKDMIPKPQIELGDFERGIFVAGTQVFKQDKMGSFAPDPTEYRQCNWVNGVTSPPGARPLVAGPIY